MNYALPPLKWITFPKCFLLTPLLLCCFLSNVFSLPSNFHQGIGETENRNSEFLEHVIKGRVLNDQEEPIAGVNIVLKGTTIGTVTDANGDYNLKLPESSGTLIFSFIGYATEEVSIDNKVVINMVLLQDISTLSEVVVTALGIKREKKALGYAITELSGKEMSTAQEVNAINSLSGKVAGVDVSLGTAGPSGSSRVIIRGNKELDGTNQPLYVIDGVPMENTQMGSAGQWGGYDLGSGIASLNPNDIESISVLKGASAAALYGSRASNGVIMITTKSGKGQKGIGVEFTSNYTFEKVLSKFDDYQKVYGQGRDGEIPSEGNANTTQVAWGAKLDPNLQVPIYNGKIKPYGVVEDNILSFFRTGSTATNTLSFSTGKEKSNIRVSVSDLRNKDIIPKTGLTRNTFLLNSSIGLGKKLTVSGKVNYITETVQNRPALSDNPNNVGLALIGIAPNFDQKWLSESYKDQYGRYIDWNGGNIYRINPYWSINEISNFSKRDRIMGFLQFNYDFTKWLSFQVRGGTDFSTFRYTNFSPKSTPTAEIGALEETSRTMSESNYEGLFKINKEFEDFYVGAFLGGNIMYTQSESFTQLGSQILAEDVKKITNFRNQTNFYGFGERQINSVYAALQTGFKDTYFLDATFRNDWSSALRKGLNSYFYPSVSGSMIFTNIIPKIPVLSFGKLRASWAEVGGDTHPYRLNLNYNVRILPDLDKPFGAISNDEIPERDLKPTETRSVEFGTDLRFFNNRVNLDLTYYKTNTINQILRLTVPGTTGYNGALINAGEITNEGVELMLSGTAVKMNDFAWDVAVNFSKNINNVVKLHPKMKSYLLANARWAGAAVMANEGETYGVIVGRKLLRDPQGNLVHNAAGFPMYGDSQEVLGRGTYKWMSGITNSFTYKGFRLSALVDIKVGADIFSMSSGLSHYNGTSKNTLAGRDEWYASEEARMAAGVKPENWKPTGGYIGKGVINTGTAENPVYESNNVPVNPQNYWMAMFEASPEPFIYDATYAKLRELTFGYTFPNRFLGKSPLEGLSISFVARNLFILYSNLPNVDPESNYNNSNGQGLEYGSIPSRRSFGFNLNAKF